jgi:hypothetical protein
MCKDLRLMLNEEGVDEVANMHSSVCALLLMDLEQLGRLRKSPSRHYWRQCEEDGALHGDMWLLSYEAGIRRWAGLVDAHVAADPHFALLRRKNVHFYDEAATLRPMFHVSQEAMQEQEISNIGDVFDLENVDDFVEFESDDGLYGEVEKADTLEESEEELW